MGRQRAGAAAGASWLVRIWPEKNELVNLLAGSDEKGPGNIASRAVQGSFGGERRLGGSVYLITDTLTGDHFTPDFPSYAELFLVRFADSHIVEVAEKVGKIIAEMMSFDHTLYKGGPDAGEGVRRPIADPKGISRRSCMIRSRRSRRTGTSI